MTCKKDCSKKLKEELTVLKERVFFAETRLRSVLAIPNDSIAWRDLRERRAREALQQIIDEYEK